MSSGASRVALWCPIDGGTSLSGGSSPLTMIGNLTGWWDASKRDGVLTNAGVPPTSWNTTFASVTDRSPNATPLLPFSIAGKVAPTITPRLSGLNGGAGCAAGAPGSACPDLHPDLGYQIGHDVFVSDAGWTFFLVWSRPNWRQNSGKDTLPITLLTVHGVPVLQADSNGGQNRLVLFPAGTAVVLTNTLSRRHTHSIVLRCTSAQSCDVWLDDLQVARGVATELSPGSTGKTLLLHDGTLSGSAQCWFHEAAAWSGALTNTEMAALLSYAARWNRGIRQGILLLLNGQSNAINYALQDGAASLLAQGIAWYVGALAYNVVASTGKPNSYTMESGHGIYAAGNGSYPGSFLNDPGDGSDPAIWHLGQDGNAVAQAVAALNQEDKQDICALVWIWNENDSLRSYSEKMTFAAAARRFLSLERTILGLSAEQLPLIWWNGIPYGSVDGIQMHREVVVAAASDRTQNVWIGNPQTSDSNARGSSWNPTTGIASGGDSGHRDSLDNQRFARLAAPIAARALLSAGRGDTLTSLPVGLPQQGGPVIAGAYRASATCIILTIAHDSGTDLKVPLQAASGAGFAVMDGGLVTNPGVIVPAIACIRTDATHLQLTLAQALVHPVAACHLYYPYGGASIGRGNAVTDNYSEIAKPSGWDIAGDLGLAWSLDFPLAATAAPIPLTDTAQ